jgi:hypothetical protein
MLAFSPININILEEITSVFTMIILAIIPEKIWS